MKPNEKFALIFFIYFFQDCNKDWIFSAGEQQFYAEKALEHVPLRCKDCRKAIKEARRRKMRKGKGRKINKERDPKDSPDADKDGPQEA